MSTTETRRQIDGLVKEAFGGVPVEVEMPIQLAESVIGFAIVGIQLQCFFDSIPRQPGAVGSRNLPLAEQHEANVSFRQTGIGGSKIGVFLDCFFKVSLRLIEYYWVREILVVNEVPALEIGIIGPGIHRSRSTEPPFQLRC